MGKKRFRKKAKRTKDSFVEMLKIVWQSSKSLTIIRLILNVLNKVLPLGTLYLIKIIIDDLVELTNNSQAHQKTFSVFFLYILAWLGLILVQNILGIILSYVREVHNHKLTENVQFIMHNKVNSLPFSYYDSYDYHNTFFRAQQESLSRPKQLITLLSSLIGNIASLTVLSSIFVTLHWALGPIFILMAIPSAYSQYAHTNRSHKFGLETTSLERKSRAINGALTNKVFAHENRIFNFGSQLAKIFTSVRRELLAGKLELHRKLRNAKLITSLTEIVVMGGIFGFIIKGATDGIFSIGSMVMYFQAFQRGQGALKAVFRLLNQVYEQRLFLGHVMDFLNLEIDSPEVDDKLPDHSYRFDSLAVENLSFTYPSSDIEVLHNLNMKTKKGQITAIVGENGSGKSTLVKILSGLYLPTRGKVLVDDLDISKYSLNSYRAKLSTLFQDFSRYQLSAGFNVSTKETDWESSRMTDALNGAGIKDLLENLPQQLDSVMTKEFKGGVELSGGQLQRLAFARTLYKDSQLLILDEPTSKVDGLNEHAFLTYLKEIARDKIVLMVSHRLSNIVIADNILVLKDGYLIEEGKHEQLINKNGHYRKMFEHQLLLDE